MARINRGILGGFRGKIANVVGSGWKGIATMRALPLSVANPQTVPQVNQRTKFAALVLIMHSLLTSMIQPLWNRFAIGKSGFNVWLSANIPNVTNAGVLVYPDFILSQGALQLSPVLGVGATAATSNFTVSWDVLPSITNALQDDKAFIAIYNETQDRWSTNSGTERGVEGDVTFAAGYTLVVADVFHVYLAFRRLDGTMVSDTGYSEGAVE